MSEGKGAGRALPDADTNGRLVTPFSLAGKRVFVSGHRGLVGSALVRRLAREACVVLTAPRAAA